MDPTLVLALIAAAPVALSIFMRSNAAITFFALCAGSVLEKHSSSATLVANSFPTRSSGSVYVHIGLLIVPALITLVLLRKSITTSKMPLNILPAVALGLTTTILLVPLLPGGVQANVLGTETWKQLDNYADFIITAGTGVSLVILALTYKIPKSHKKH